MGSRRTRSVRKTCKRCGIRRAQHRVFQNRGRAQAYSSCRECESAASKIRVDADPFRAERVSWRQMRTRCNNPNDGGYRRYGGRGIRVCDRWASFQPFLEDMGARPSLQHSIDRIDNDGDYTPENCRWATQSEQQSNTSRNRMLTHNGVTLTMAEWARRLGMNIQTLHMRLTAQGWSTEKALSTPVGNRKHKGP